MKYVEVRRHSMRLKPTQVLSQAGVRLAQSIAKPNQNFAIVATSGLGRAEHTANAMGQAVTHEINELGYLPHKIFKKIGWPYQVGRLEKVLAKQDDVLTFASRQADVWRDIASKLSDGEVALIITHGVIGELAISMLKNSINDLSATMPLGYCEGVCLQFDDERLLNCKKLEAPYDNHLLEN